MSVWSQAISGEYLNEMNKILPHKFKEIRTGSTIEVIRDLNAVKIYLLVDDIEQYEQILIERSDEAQTNFSQCKLLMVGRGKYPNNYVELTDHYPFSSKMSNLYRVKTITSDGIIRMYAPVTIIIPELKKK
jgi:hypothetical protein